VPPDDGHHRAAEERAAIVTFLQDVTRRPPPNVDHADAYHRVWAIAESIERDALSPAQARARIRDIARTTSEPLSTVLFTAAKGIVCGKHLPKAPAAQQGAAGPCRQRARARLGRALRLLGALGSLG
jgi:hypothetical protein